MLKQDRRESGDCFGENYNEYQKSRAQNLHIYAIDWTMLNQRSQTYLNPENIFQNMSSDVLWDYSFWNTTLGKCSPSDLKFILPTLLHHFHLWVLQQYKLNLFFWPYCSACAFCVSSPLIPTDSLDLQLLMTWYHSVIQSPLEFASWNILSANNYIELLQEKALVTNVAWP